MPRPTAPAAAAASTRASQPAAISPERLAEGRKVTDEKCTTCHGMESETAGGKTPEGWNAAVEQMIGLGAQVTDEEAKIIIDYLSHTFPPKK